MITDLGSMIADLISLDIGSVDIVSINNLFWDCSNDCN